MKKRIISLILVLVMLFSSCLILTACNEEEPEEPNNGDSPETPETPAEPTDFEIDGEFLVTYNSNNILERKVADRFISDFNNKFNIKLNKQSDKSNAIEREILIGNIASREEYTAASSLLSQYKADGLGVAIVRVSGTRISIFGSDDVALSVAAEHTLDTLIDKDRKIKKDLDELIIFNKFEYENKGEIVGYKIDEISALADAYAIFVDDKPVVEFAPELKRYTLETTFKAGYPKISVTPMANNCGVAYTQPSFENNGEAKITITAADKKTIVEYVIKVNMEMSYTIPAEVVNPNGKDAVVTFVVDDGRQDTGDVTKTLLANNSKLKLTYALKAMDLATLRYLDANGNGTTNGSLAKAYRFNGNGTYTYTTNTTNTSYWQAVKNNATYGARTEMASHTYSHKWHGTNDDGGFFSYYDNTPTLHSNAGDPLRNNLAFLKGSSSKEIIAASEIIHDKFSSQSSLALVHPGIGVRTSDYEGVKTYKTFFNEVLAAQIAQGKLIGSRGTFSAWKNKSAGTVVGYSDVLSKVNTPAIVDERRVSGIYALMVEKGQILNQTSNPKNDNISVWTNYIDAAIDKKGWACYCIHNISTNATESGHWIKTAWAEKLFKYATDRSSKVEVMNLTEAMLYYREWNAANVTATAYKTDYITVTLSFKDKVSAGTATVDSYMNTYPDVYNKALTIKVDIPDDWTGVKVGSTNLTIHTEGNSRFVYVDVTPRTEGVKLVGVK